MATVKFNNVDEFIEELNTEFGFNETASMPIFGIVRVTNQFVSTNVGPLQHLFVLATFKSGVDIVRLDRFVGDIWKHEGQDKPVYERAEEVRQKIVQACAELKLEVRAGLWEESKP